MFGGTNYNTMYPQLLELTMRMCDILFEKFLINY